MSHTASEPNGPWYGNPIFLNIPSKTHPKFKTKRMSIFLLYTTTLLLHFVQHWFQYISRLASLFLSGRITLKVTFFHFSKYIFKSYKCINRHFEKPKKVLFHQYRCTPLFLHLKQWCITNEAVSLIQLHYARIKRNPE